MGEYYNIGVELAQKCFTYKSGIPSGLRFLDCDVQAGFWDEWERLNK